jgi:hypothetical protein
MRNPPVVASAAVNLQWNQQAKLLPHCVDLVLDHQRDHFLKINLGSVIFPIDTATSSHPAAPNSFSLVCIFWVSGRTSMILY